MEIKTKIFLSSSILVLISVLVITTAVIVILSQGVENQTEQLVEDLHASSFRRIRAGNETLQDVVSNIIIKNEYAAETLCLDQSIREGILQGNWKSIVYRLEALCKRLDIDFLVVFDAEGNFLTSWPAQIKEDYPESHFKQLPLFRNFRKYIESNDLSGVPVFTLIDRWSINVLKGYNTDSDQEDNLVILSAGIVANDYYDEPVGYVFSGIPGFRLTKFFKQYSKTTGQVTMLADGVKPLVWAGLPMKPEKLSEALQEVARNQNRPPAQVGTGTRIDDSGQEYYFQSTPLSVFSDATLSVTNRAASMSLIVGESARLIVESSEKIRQQGEKTKVEIQKTTLLVVLLVLSLTAYVANLVGKKIARPIVLAAEMSDTIASGDFTHKLNASGNDETGLLSRSMNILVDRLTDLNEKNLHQVDALRASNQRTRTILDSIQIGVVLIDGETNQIIDVNPAALAMAGLQREDLIGSTCSRFLCSNRGGSCPARTHGASACSSEHSLVSTSGKKLELLKTVVPITLDGHDCFLESIVDITERKEAEQALWHSERRMAQIIDFLPDPTFVIDKHGTILFWNRATEKLTGVSSESMVGKGNYEYSIPFYNHRKPVLIDLAREWDNKTASEYTTMVRKNGQLAAELRNLAIAGDDSWFWSVACPLVDDEGTVIGAIETLRNITDMKRTEQQLRETGNRYRTLFDLASDAILILNGSIIVDCNVKAIEMFGYPRDEMIDSSIDILSPLRQADGKLSTEESRKRIQSVRPGEVDVFEWVHWKRSGNEFDAEVSLAGITLDSGTYVQAIIRDITERNRTRELMIQTEKMMSVGGLAAGMAHEINNPLGIILQSVQNASRRLGTELSQNQTVASEVGLDLEILQKYLEQRSISTYLETIKTAGERAARIVRSMLNFSRKSESNRAMHSVNSILDQVLDMVSNDYDLKKQYDFRSVEIVRDYGDIPDIQCVETEIAQVFLNLIKNAAQAMGMHGHSGDRPRIVLKTEQQGDSVAISIADNGPGMDEHHTKAVFEPFFTTKPPGEGTGLGLSVSYFIITAHHRGTFEVKSSAGNGAVFTIRLPI